jgi:NAD-dependent dihydropyrimidine dehydrogenase PreA subunit
MACIIALPTDPSDIVGTPGGVVVGTGAFIIFLCAAKNIQYMPDIVVNPLNPNDQRGVCEFNLAWCMWGKKLSANDKGRPYWLKNGTTAVDCGSCYTKCKANSNVWPVKDCPNGGDGGPKWPGPNDNFQPVWPN